MNFQQVTEAMQRLEVEVTRQQKYIAKWGEKNDKNPDSFWISYKNEAERYLLKWDLMKSHRNELKTNA